MPFLHEYPYTDFHEMNLDWLIDKLGKLEVEHETNSVNIGTVQYYYVDGVYGDNNNDGLTPATAFKTLAQALKLINQGVKDLGVTFCASGTYYIPNGLRTVTNIALHMNTLNNEDIRIEPEIDRFVAYNCHFSWYGTAGHPMTIAIDTFRLDGGQLWCDYVHFEKRLGNNVCNSKLRW